MVKCLRDLLRGDAKRADGHPKSITRLMSSYIAGPRRVSVSGLQVIVNYCISVGVHVPGYILEITAKDYLFDKIVSIEQLDTVETFDIEVEKDHSFVVNGFVLHNCQGSEYPTAIILVPRSHPNMMTRQWVYTAETRAKREVHIFSAGSAIDRYVGNEERVRRTTFLADLTEILQMEVKDEA